MTAAGSLEGRNAGSIPWPAVSMCKELSLSAYARQASKDAVQRLTVNRAIGKHEEFLAVSLIVNDLRATHLLTIPHVKELKIWLAENFPDA